MSDYKLGFIGSGNMAEAILRGILNAGLYKPAEVVASDIDAQRRELFGLLGVATTEDNTVPAGAPRTLIAVKPQKLGEALGGLSQAFPTNGLVISIAAGVSTQALDEWIGGRGRIVRVMPNTPMLVGCGMAAVAAGPRAEQDDVEEVVRLFATGGQAVVVDEHLMDAVTAVSGSGPAYFFYLVEAMIAAGEAEGLASHIARLLAAQTCLGAGKMLMETDDPPEKLRRRVTSPGGTTERAARRLDGAGVKQALVDAIRAAAERSRELGGK
jgi:pyrroline-5-carboxylate reductase